MTTAERNRKLKKVCEQHFGRGKVRVRGSRGTAYGWVTLDIDVTPTSYAERHDLTTKVWELIRKNEIQIGTYGYDDPGSDYGYGRTIHINFNPIPRDEVHAY